MIKKFTTIKDFLNQYMFVVCLAIILVAAVASRLYKLGEIPAGITWDEAAIGYNGYAIITTRRDEWLVKLPVSFQSFGDYKAPLAIYINGAFTYFLGLHPWSVRLPFALAGIMFVAAFGWLVYELTTNSSFQRQATLAGMLFALFSPWHFHFSRVGFESGIAVALITLGLASIFSAKRNLLEHSTKKLLPYTFLSIGAISFVLSIYTYHSAKIVVPLLLLVLLPQLWKVIKENVVFILILVALAAAGLYPVITDSIFGNGATRSNVLIFSQHLSTPDILRTFSENFIVHFSLDFLINGKVDSPRHGAGQSGVLSIVSFLLVLSGIILSVQQPRLVVKKYFALFSLGFAMLVFGIVPAALSAESVPHSNRALLSVIGFLLLAVYGCILVLKFALNHSKLFYRLAFGLIVLISTISFIHFFEYYITQFPAISTQAFQEGYLQAFETAKAYEKGEDGKPEVDKILVSTEYGQPYIYALFVKHPSPIAYQGGTLYKYEFSDAISNSDLARNNTLILATPKSGMDESQAVQVIKGSDGSTRFMIFYTGQQ